VYSVKDESDLILLGFLAFLDPPKDTCTAALKQLARLSVDVKILMPGPYHDEPAVRRASRRTWPALLRGNVELYEFQPTMIHGKIVLVDGAVTSIGSINFDPRSFALNAEFGVVALDTEITSQLEHAFVADLGRSRRVMGEDIRRLSPWQNLLDTGCYWIRAQL